MALLLDRGVDISSAGNRTEGQMSRYVRRLRGKRRQARLALEAISRGCMGV
jgi:hypothetical protein